MSSIEYLHRVAQQVLITTDEQGISYAGYGSGFFMEYQERLFFITAAHLLFSETNPHELISDYLQVIVDWNKHYVNEQLVGKFFHLSNIYIICNADIEMLKLLKDENEQSVGIRDFVSTDDIAFSIIPQDKLAEVLNICTDELRDEKQIYCSKGTKKIPVEEHFIGTSMQQGDKCVVHGITLSEPRGLVIQPCLRHYCGLEYIGDDSDGNYILFSSKNVVHEKWKGLSGSPVFNYKYQLIGVLLRTIEKNDTVIVVPISKVIKQLQYFLTNKYNEIIL